MLVRTWPVAAKLVALCVGVAAAVAIGLTALAYTLASGGLKQQAEAALWSDGLLVANQIDAWNAKRLSEVKSLAALPAVRLVEIACTAAPALILARLELRVRDGSRHPGHLDHELHAELAAEVEQGGSAALGLDAAVLRYDSGAPDCAAALLARLAARLDAPA